MHVKWIRLSHRWLGLFVGIQLMLWTASGLYFAWNPIEEVRGDHLVAAPAGFTAPDTVLASPARAMAEVLRRPDVAAVDAVTTRFLPEGPVYELTLRTNDGRRYALADARTGALRGPLTEAEAVALAEADFVPEAAVVQVERVETAPEGSEYRGVALPAYRVTFDHETGTRLYVSADRGVVAARRNDTWRTFDFLWMLHIMDFEARDNFNTWLLKGFSVLGVITVLSGFLLWGMTSPWLRRRGRRGRDVPTPSPRPRGTRPVELPV